MMDNRAFTFGASLSACACEALDNPAVRALWNGFTFGCGSLDFNVPNTPASTTNAPCSFCTPDMTPPELPDGKEYAVRITPHGVSIAAADSAALARGLIALMLKIEPENLEPGKERFRISCGEFTDAFVLKRRMIHLCVFPETTLFALQKLLRLCAALQYTHVVVEFWGMFQYQCLKELSWPQAYTKGQIAPLFDEARELGVQIIPMFNMLGHATASRVCGGKHVVLDQNPRLQSLFTIDGWSWNLSSDKVRELLSKVRHELYDLCGDGEYFHIGCDEDYHKNDPEHTSKIPQYLQQTAKEILAEGRRPILWGDMLLAREACGVTAPYCCSSPQAKDAEDILAALPRECVIADWQYDVKSAPWKTSQYLRDKGFDVLCAPWYEAPNYAAALQTAREENLFGVMLTTWHTLNRETPSIAAFANALGVSRAAFTGKSHPYAETAALLRRLSPGAKRYEDCGWMEKQITVSAWPSC